MAASRPKPETIDAYLESLPQDQRAALERVRRTVRACVPRAEEGFSYGLPAFRLDGRPLVAFGATARHCAFYPISGSTVEEHRDLLEGFSTSKGTIRFQPDHPLPAATIRTLVKARLAELGAPAGATKPRGGRTAGGVTAFRAALDHPLKEDVEAARRILLAAAPGVSEGIKWNAPSFRTTDDFATFNLRAKDALRIVFHRGAKAKTGTVQVPDPEGLLEWRGRDRAVATFRKGEVRARRKALAAIARAWVRNA